MTPWHPQSLQEISSEGIERREQVPTGAIALERWNAAATDVCWMNSLTKGLLLSHNMKLEKQSIWGHGHWDQHWLERDGRMMMQGRRCQGEEMSISFCKWEFMEATWSPLLGPVAMCHLNEPNTHQQKQQGSVFATKRHW